MAENSMKALSIRQPWVYAITDMDKRIENRTWAPPPYIFGEYIAIHASKKKDLQGWPDFLIPPPLDELVYGAIVATAKIVGWLDENGRGSGIVPNPCMGHLVDDRWFFGPIGWVLDDVRKVGPFECKGMLGLWNVPSDIAVKIREKTDGNQN